MKKRKEKFKLEVVAGTFKGDYWTFDSIADADEFIINTIKEGCEDLVKLGAMKIFHGKEVVGHR